MTRICTWIVLGLVFPLGLAAQERPLDRRSALEARVEEQFLQRSARELSLSADARERLGEILRQTAEERRAIAREAGRIRTDLTRATNAASAPDTEIERLLSELDALRERELGIWRREQRALAEVLTPRQRARFLFLRARFNDRLLELRRQRRPRGAPGSREDRPAWFDAPHR